MNSENTTLKTPRFDIDSYLKNIQDNKPHLEFLKERGEPDVEDVCTLYLKGKQQEILQLTENINKFESPGQHFTKEYRILEGYCGKLLNDLDGIDVTGRDDLRVIRKSSLGDINALIGNLKSKVHLSGTACSQCEVKV